MSFSAERKRSSRMSSLSVSSAGGSFSGGGDGGAPSEAAAIEPSVMTMGSRACGGLKVETGT